MGVTPDERRRRQAERLRAKRAAMTPEQRAAARAEHDRRYRETHREERRESQLRRYYAGK